MQAVHEGRSPVVLTERTEHLAHLAERLSPEIRHLIILRGGMGRKELGAVIAQLAAIPENEERVLLATGRYLGEGFDDARLDTLFLTLPVSWRGTVAQYVGRLHRLHDRKREVRVYDYADLNVPMLARMFDRRCRGYEAVGYQPGGREDQTCLGRPVPRRRKTSRTRMNFISRMPGPPPPLCYVIWIATGAPCWRFTVGAATTAIRLWICWQRPSASAARLSNCCRYRLNVLGRFEFPNGSWPGPQGRRKSSLASRDRPRESWVWAGRSSHPAR